MLGWEVLVYRASTPDIFIARWRSSVNGLRWLDELVNANKAVDLGGNGYPCKYAVAAGVLLPMIKGGLPKNDSPPTIGEDYVLPEGWSSDVTWDQREVLHCQGGDQLIVEAWDQS